MTQFTDMRDRIADEVARTTADDKTFISREILSAVAHYESTRFRFNEVRDWAIATTVVDQLYYTLTEDFLYFDNLKLNYNGTYVTLVKKSWKWIEHADNQVDPITGTPHSYVIYAGELRIFPAANGTYSMVGSYVQRAPSFSASYTLSSAWLTSKGAEEMIRARAKAAYLINYTDDPIATQAQGMMAQMGKRFYNAQEEMAYISLVDEANDAQSSGKLAGSGF